MNTDPKTKKLYIFFSPRNPLWQRIRELETIHRRFVADEPDASPSKFPSGNSPFLPSEPHRLLATNHQTYRERSQGRFSRRNDSEVLIRHLAQSLKAYAGSVRDKRATELAAMIDRFLNELTLQPNLSAYESAEALDLDMIETQRIFDEYHYKTKVLLGNAYYSSFAEADAAHVSIGRLFWMYLRRRKHDGTPFWLRGTVHLRYALQTPGGWVLRVKAHIPKVNPTKSDISACQRKGRGHPFVENDGFVHSTGGQVWWLMEQRHATDVALDYFTLVTGLRSPRHGREEGEGTSGPAYAGQYLTTDQNGRRPIISDVAFLQSADDGVSEDDLQAHIRKVMWFDSGVITDDALKHRLDRWQHDLEAEEGPRR